MTFANSLDPRWGPTNCGASSGIQTVWHSDYNYYHISNYFGNTLFFAIFERNVLVQHAKISFFVGPHLGSKLFDTQIIIIIIFVIIIIIITIIISVKTSWKETMDFCNYSKETFCSACWDLKRPQLHLYLYPTDKIVICLKSQIHNIDCDNVIGSLN